MSDPNRVQIYSVQVVLSASPNCRYERVRLSQGHRTGMSRLSPLIALTASNSERTLARPAHHASRPTRISRLNSAHPLNCPCGQNACKQFAKRAPPIDPFRWGVALATLSPGAWVRACHIHESGHDTVDAGGSRFPIALHGTQLLHSPHG